MSINEDLRICEEIKDQYKNLNLEEGGEEVFKLSQLALAMYDRLNNLRFDAAFYIKNLDIAGQYTKSELREFLKGKMKVMEYIHIQCRAAVIAHKDDKKFSRY